MTPAADAFLDLDKSNRSTPSQDSRWQLSGPEIPGVQIREDGNLLLITSNASTRLYRFLANYGASVRTTTDGSNDSFERELS